MFNNSGIQYPNNMYNCIKDQRYIFSLLTIHRLEKTLVKNAI